MKMLGILCILCGSVMVGVYYRGREIARYHNLVELFQGMTVMQGEILSVQTPLPDAVNQAAKRTRGVTSRFLYDVSENLVERNMNMKLIWEKEVQKYFDEKQLKKEDKEELIRMGDVIGYLDVEMQGKSIEMYRKRLETSIQRQQEEVKKKAGLYPILFVCAGILCCLILV